MMEFVGVAALGGLAMVLYGVYRQVERGLEYFRIQRIKEAVMRRQLPATAYDPYKEMDFADVIKSWMLVFTGYLIVLATNAAYIKMNSEFVELFSPSSDPTAAIAVSKNMLSVFFTAFATRLAGVMLLVSGLIGIVQLLWIYVQRQQRG